MLHVRATRQTGEWFLSQKITRDTCSQNPCRGAAFAIPTKAARRVGAEIAPDGSIAVMCGSKFLLFQVYDTTVFSVFPFKASCFCATIRERHGIPTFGTLSASIPAASTRRASETARCRALNHVTRAVHSSSDAGNISRRLKRVRQMFSREYEQNTLL